MNLFSWIEIYGGHSIILNAFKNIFTFFKYNFKNMQKITTNISVEYIYKYININYIFIYYLFIFAVWG